LTVPSHINIRPAYTYAREKYAINEKIWWEHLKKRDHSRENYVDGSIIF
jgi:hypothetical protein